MTVDLDFPDPLDLFGKDVEDLQDNIRIRSDRIVGTLKYVDDYTSAGYTGEEASGNYLVVHCAVPDVEGVTITASVTPGRVVTLDEDGVLISRISDKSSQTLTVVASKDGYDSVTKEFVLNGLTVRTA